MMKPTKQILSIGIATLTVAMLFALVFGVATPALSTALRGGLFAPAPPPGDPIPITGIENLTSLNATVTVDVNGKINGERTQGSLTGLLTTNDQNKSRVTVSGPLLGEIAAQVGGSVVGLFTPSKVDLYKTPDGAYIVINGLVPVCVKPKASKTTAALDDLSPSGMLTMLTAEDVARGKFVGEETLNGVPVRHYVINGDAFLAAAQSSDDPKLRAFGDALWSADDADVWVDVETGYPVAFSGSYSGEFEPLGFEGDFGVQIELTDVNTNSPVNLPAACNRPISR